MMYDQLSRFKGHAKRATKGFVDIPCGFIAVLVMLACSISLHAQSLSVFDVDATSFPTITAKFYAFDADGNQISGLSPGDIQVQEDGAPRTVSSISCPPVSPPSPISSVLTIDISGSMQGSGMQAAKAAATVWVNMLPLGVSECAITTFNGSSYLNQDFTTDRPSLLNAINALNSGGMTDYDDALMTPPAGSLEVSKRAKNKKVVVFLSDGQPNNAPNQSAIITQAQSQGATIYGVILNMSAPQVVKDICAQTGGLWFENIDTEQQAEEVYRQILQTAQGGEPCELEWISDGCTTNRQLEATLPALGISAETSYRIPVASQPQLVYNPSRSLRFGEVTPGTQSQQQITITAQGKPARIDAISSSNTWFTITSYGGNAPPFTLGSGQSRTLTVEYAPLDSSVTFCLFKVVGDACRGNSLYADGGWTGMQSQQVQIKVTRANGGEQFIAGSEEELTWEGVMPDENIILEYSTDGGSSWILISDTAHGLQYTWRVPKTPGNQCLLQATAIPHQPIIPAMVPIPAGTFRMGNITNHPPNFSTEKPVHEVTITEPFLMSRTEITQAQYEAVMGTNPSYYKGADHPVGSVNWYDAVAFCNALSLQEGLSPCYLGSGPGLYCFFERNGYRLPTEAEWEYACRGGTETDIFTGNLTNDDCTPLDPALDLAGWYCGNANSAAHPVGLKEPNSFGLYDMHGNVWEWCWDRYDSRYYGSSPVDDPRGPALGTDRAIRGGSFDWPARYCRSATRRDHVHPSSRSNYGFRIVRTY
jgi:VWFA-related protein